MRKLTVTLAAAALLLLLGPTAALADVVHLVDGRKIEGKILSVEDGVVAVEAKFGVLKFKAAEIKSIERGETEWERLRREATEARAKLADDATADQVLEVARAAREADLYQMEDELVARALEIDPDHAATRKFLGQVKHEGEWVEEAVAIRSQAREKGEDAEWVTASEAETRATEIEERREARRLTRLERKVKRNFERLYSRSRARANDAYANLAEISADEELPGIMERADEIMAYANKMRKLYRESSVTTVDIRATMLSGGDIRTVPVNLGTIGRAAINVPIELPSGRLTGVGTSVGVPSGR